ncbi:MAG: hypothetical protein M0R38_11845 [Bacteroidia bacterium]|nr:hypothetical protein [Bacteroidia bacterium]
MTKFEVIGFPNIAHNGEQIGDSGGLNWTGSSIQTDSEPMCFHRANLQIFSECGTHSADKKAETLNLALHPPFCQTAVSGSAFLFLSGC